MIIQKIEKRKKEVKKVHGLAITNTTNQIKSEKHLTDHSESVKFVFNEFDKLKK